MPDDIQRKPSNNPFPSGCGEAGAIAAFPAITNAILDALAPLRVTDLTGPAIPEQIW